MVSTGAAWWRLWTLERATDTPQIPSPHFAIRHSHHVPRLKQQHIGVTFSPRAQGLGETATAEQRIVQVPAGLSALPGPGAPLQGLQAR